MPEQSPAEKLNIPKIKQGIPTVYGVVIMLVVLVGVLVMYFFMAESQDLIPTPLISVDRSVKDMGECVAGETCAGPTVSAQDPEGDLLTYKFYDKVTGELVDEVVAPSGEEVTPKFKFGSAGEKELYMVVEDGSGHTSKDYPIIVPVK